MKKSRLRRQQTAIIDDTPSFPVIAIRSKHKESQHLSDLFQYIRGEINELPPIPDTTRSIFPAFTDLFEEKDDEDCNTNVFLTSLTCFADKSLSNEKGRDKKEKPITSQHSKSKKGYITDPPNRFTNQAELFDVISNNYSDKQVRKDLKNRDPSTKAINQYASLCKKYRVAPESLIGRICEKRQVDIAHMELGEYQTTAVLNSLRKIMQPSTADDFNNELKSRVGQRLNLRDNRLRSSRTRVFRNTLSLDDVLQIDNMRRPDGSTQKYTKNRKSMKLSSNIFAESAMKSDILDGSNSGKTSHLNPNSVLAALELGSKMNNLQVLDLSHNSLFSNISSAIQVLLLNTRLKRLILSSCGINDVSVKAIAMAAVKCSKNEGFIDTLEELDLSNNNIQEVSTVDINTIITAASQLAILDVSINSIGKGCTEILETVALQCSSPKGCRLHSLNLHWNNMKDVPPSIGMALERSTSLKTLNISQNNISVIPSICLLNGMASNPSMTNLNLAQNPVGEVHVARAVCRVLRDVYKQKVFIDLSGCNLIGNSRGDVKLIEGFTVDTNEPEGTYTFDMQNACDRASACELLRLVNLGQGFRFKSISHNKQKVTIVPLSETSFYEKEVKNGTSQQLEEIDFALSTLVLEVKPMIPWRLPFTGILEIEFIYERSLPRMEKNAVTPASWKSLINTLLTTFGPHREAFGDAIISGDLWLTSSQMIELIALQIGHENRRERLGKICTVIPRIIDTEALSRLINSTLNIAERAFLRSRLGEYLRFDPWMPSGHYVLDLSKEWERCVGDKLIQVNNLQKAQKYLEGVPDTSQAGDYDNFRNESLNGTDYDLNDRLPYEGTLIIDYVSTTSIGEAAEFISSDDLAVVMKRIGLTQRDKLLEHFSMMVHKKKEYSTHQEDLKRSPFDVTTENERRDFLFKTKKARVLTKISWLRQNIKEALHKLRVQFKNKYVKAEQAVQISLYFPIECGARAASLVILHQRVIDRYNLFIAAEAALSKPVLEELLFRIGWLNLFNPDIVDRSYRLNLEKSDEYKLVEYLVHLAVIEPGENWINEHWSATRCIGEWSLPASWEEGDIPKEGIVTLTYYTGPKCKKPKYRRSWWKETLLFNVTPP